MKLPNLSEWPLRHQQFVGFLIAVAVVIPTTSFGVGEGAMLPSPSSP